jgi:hypothetical protein
MQNGTALKTKTELRSCGTSTCVGPSKISTFGKAEKRFRLARGINNVWTTRPRGFWNAFLIDRLRPSRSAPPLSYTFEPIGRFEPHGPTLILCRELSNLLDNLKYQSVSVRLYFGKKPVCPIRPS